MAERTCELKKVVIFYKGAHFTNSNITDKVANSYLKENPSREKDFKEYPKGYAVKSDNLNLAETKKNLGEAKRTVKSRAKDLNIAKAGIKEKAVEVEILAEELENAVKAVSKVDDEKKEGAVKAAKAAGDAHDKAEKELAEMDVDVLAVKLEEAESEVVKYESLLVKRDK